MEHGKSEVQQSVMYGGGQGQANMASHQEKQFSGEVINYLPGIFYVLDRNGRFVRWNQRLCEISGYRPEELAGMHAPEMFDHDVACRVQERIEEVFRLGESDMEASLLTKDGRRIPFYFTGHRTSMDGQACLVGLGIDITEHKNADDRLRASEERFRLLADNIAQLAWMADGNGCIVWYNQRWFDYTGTTLEEMQGGGWQKVHHPDHLDRVVARIRHSFGTGEPWEDTFPLKGAQGEYRWFLSRAIPQRDASGRILRWFGTHTDITAQLEIEEELQKFKFFSDHANELQFLIDQSGGVRYANQLACERLGYGEVEVLGMSISDIDPLHPKEKFEDLFLRSKQGRLPPFEGMFRRRGGTTFPVEIAAAVMEFKGRWLMFASARDISERKLAEERVLEAARQDQLTGLPNRAFVFEFCSHLIAAAERSHGSGALLFIDLDRFKPINDLYGHETGDLVLQEVSKRLLACTRKEDLVGRLGGDEFVIVLPHLDAAGEHRATVVAQHVIESISRPFQIGRLGLSLSPSIGISYFPEHAQEVSALIHAADLAMYQAKQSGRANYRIYTTDLDQRADETLWIEATLKDALKQGGFELHYQPVVGLRESTLAGAEALLRLRSGNGKQVGPDRFIPVAESAGLIEEIGEWVIRQACRQNAAWQAQGLPPLPIAVNVSPLQFRQKAFAERLAAILAECGTNPKQIQIEVTESTVMDSVDEAIGILRALKSHGIKIALDDFGTGYSSLSYLSNLPLDKLKVDQAFVQRAASDKASRAITETIIALGTTLNLEVVGEGIDSEEALEYLRQHGCDQAQGFLFSRPLPAAEFAKWYAASREWLKEPLSDEPARGDEIPDVAVLVVDDQPADLQLIQGILADLGISVLTAGNGEEAIDVARSRDLAIVLMDMRMPGIDGFETARRLRQLSRHSHTPIVFCTAQTPGKEEMLDGYKAGAVDYLFKPLIPEVLRAKVVTFVDLYRKNQELRIHAAQAASHRQLRRDMVELEQRANYDMLTGLPSRKLVFERLEQDIAHSGRQREKLGLMLMNLDRFKQINERLGRHVGDSVLRQAAECLHGSVRKGDVVGRLGGDEFAVVFTGLADQDNLAMAVRKCLDSLGGLKGRDHELHLTASAGITVFPDDGIDVTTLLNNASLALSRVKERGRNGYEFYQPEMSRRAQRRIDTENALRQGLENEEFQLLYQPKLDIASRHFIGIEALLRWQHGAELVSPGEFLPVAEAVGLITPLGLWGLRTALRQLKQWDEQLAESRLRLSVNLSLRELQNRHIADDIAGVLEETKVDADRLELEITESSAMHDLAQVEAALTRLREIGVHLALDNFGREYSTLRLLEKLPFETVKIDRSFITDMVNKEQDRAMTKAVIGMARDLNINTVAEGVETREQFDLLKAVGCNVVQGFLVSPPVRSGELAKVLDREKEIAEELLGV